MVSDTLLRLALCVAQGSLDFDTLLRFVTLGDSESLVKRYTSVLRPFGLLNALVMRYTLVFRALLSSIMRTLVPCALLGGPSSFHVHYTLCIAPDMERRGFAMSTTHCVSHRTWNDDGPPKGAGTQCVSHRTSSFRPIGHKAQGCA